MKSVGLGLECVPFHGGWKSVEWKLAFTLSELIEMEFDQICVEIEEEESVASVGPRIELDLGEGSSIHGDLPAVEVPSVVPTVEIEEEDSSVELVISEREISLIRRREQGVSLFLRMPR